MKILVVDDSPIMRRIVINALKVIGYQSVAEAEDGLQGLNVMQNDGIDFVITDWNMPNMTGLDLTHAIRSNDKTRHIPILMVTTRGNKEDVLSALEARVNNYLVKPFTPTDLKEKIDKIMSVVKR